MSPSPFLPATLSLRGTASFRTLPSCYSCLSRRLCCSCLLRFLGFPRFPRHLLRLRRFLRFLRTLRFLQFLSPRRSLWAKPGRFPRPFFHWCRQIHAFLRRRHGGWGSLECRLPHGRAVLLRRGWRHGLRRPRGRRRIVEEVGEGVAISVGVQGVHRKMSVARHFESARNWPSQRRITEATACRNTRSFSPAAAALQLAPARRCSRRM